MTDGLSRACRRGQRLRGRHRAHNCDGWPWVNCACACDCHRPSSSFQPPVMALDPDFESYVFVCRREDMMT